MKNLFTRLMLVAVAAMGFVACQEGIDEVVVTTQNKVTVEFTGAFNDDTRSQFGEKDENGYPSTWSGNEAAYFSLNAADFVKATNSLDGSNASWSVEFTDDGSTTGTIYAFSPVNNSNTGGFKKIYANYEDVTVYVPSSQSPSTTSVAEPVHMLAATHNYTDGIPTAVGLEFEHILAYGKMQITGLSNVEISSVTVTSPIPFAGTNCYYYYATKTWDKVDVDSITINNPETSNYTFWFGCVPVELKTGNLVVVVTATDGTTYTKTIALSETKHLNFTKGIVSSFSVNMSTEDVVVETPMQLIVDGDYVIAVSYDDSKYIMTASTGNYQGYADYIEPVDGIVTAPAESVWNIVYNGDGTYTIRSVSEEMYLSWESGNSAKLIETKDEITKMVITSDEEFFYIQSYKDQTRYLQFNSTSEQERFAFYTSAQKKTLLLIPAKYVVVPSFTVSPNTDQIISADGGEIEFTVTPKNGAVVTAESSDPTWLTIDDTFKATALANNSEKEREATITFKADGCEAVPVVITQPAKPAEVAGTWTLVTDASSLAVDDQVVIVAVDYNYALSTTQNSNNRGQAAITKDGETVAFGSDVQILTLKEGTVDGTFALYTGSGYLYAASSSSNNLKTQITNNDNGSWKITINNSVATIKAQGTYTRNWLRYNNGSSIFSCYGSGQTDVAIYRLGGEPDTTPRFTVSPTEQSIGAEGGEIQFTVTTYNGAVVTAESSDTTWLTIDNTFNATVDPNETAETRSATITFSAEDCEEVVVTVSQKGKSTESTYTKITSADDLSDGKYIIVYEDSSNAYVFNGVDEVNGYFSASITNNDTISGTFADGEVTIAAMDGGYSLKVANGYMSGTSGSNTLKFGTTASANTFEFNADGTVKITSNTSVFTFNGASNQLRFRYYKSSSYESMGAVTLYKKN